MRSAFFVLSGLLLSACAIGVGGEGEGPTGTTHHDAAPFATNDAGAQPDEGTLQQPTVDSGTTTVDSGNNTTGCSFAGVLATYDFTGAPGNQTSTNATTTTSGVTATAFTRSSGVTATSGVAPSTSAAA